jgi:hypothetical protein
MIWFSYDEKLTLSDGKVKFFGSEVGEANQSVQTTVSFPHIFMSENRKRRKKETLTSTPFFQSLKEFIFDTKSEDQSASSHGHGIDERVVKFSTPFYHHYQGVGGGYISVKERSVAYFEIAIIDPTNIGPTKMDCIAVGLASKHFKLIGTLPGWCPDSFGYHSDDGAIFHGRGQQLQTYGPRFGRGDIVGCGFCYESYSIFFTLNGRYLGKAFKNVKMATPLFPTVGIDAQVDVEFNFGMKPFKFRLCDYISSVK